MADTMAAQHVKFPCAYGLRYAIVTADEGQKGHEYACLECDERMVWVSGATGRQKHFRHFMDSGEHDHE